jgi:hypothetical protein
MRSGIDAPTEVFSREFGEVVWERSDELSELDPLDFHFTHEPIAVMPEARDVFVELVREAAPAVVLVYASHARFWKGDRELEGQTSIYVGWDESRHVSPGTLRLVQEAAREAGIDCSAGSLGAPVEPPLYATVLYQESAG